MGAAQHRADVTIYKGFRKVLDGTVTLAFARSERPVRRLRSGEKRVLGHHRFDRRRLLYGSGLRLATCLCIVGMLCAHTLVRAESATAGTSARDVPDAVTFYRSSGERRETGRVRQLFSWLDVSALAEAEWLQRRSRTFDGQTGTRDTGPDAVLQLEWEARLTPWATIELGHEYDTAGGGVTPWKNLCSSWIATTSS